VCVVLRRCSLLERCSEEAWEGLVDDYGRGFLPRHSTVVACAMGSLFLAQTWSSVYTRKPERRPSNSLLLTLRSLSAPFLPQAK